MFYCMKTKKLRHRSILHDKYIILFGICFSLLIFTVLGKPTGYAVFDAGADRAYGNLYVSSSPPGADVYVDGELRAATPVKVMGLSAGTHELVVRSTGYPTKVSDVTIVDGQTTRLAITLLR